MSQYQSQSEPQANFPQESQENSPENGTQGQFSQEEEIEDEVLVHNQNNACRKPGPDDPFVLTKEMVEVIRSCYIRPVLKKTVQVSFLPVIL